jgi:F0F1-type ATP synthase membrane subunit b/b'
MKRLSIIFIIGTFVTLLICSNLFAAPPTILERIGKQQKRIDVGIANGELTRAEAKTLQENLNWIRSEALRLKADGRLTPRERARLHRLLDRNSKMIYRKKHNPIIRLYP